MKTFKLLPASFLMLVLFSCNARQGKDSLDRTLDSSPKQDQTTSSSKQSSPEGASSGDSVKVSASPAPIKTIDPDWDKKIIKTATLDLEVKDFKPFNDNIHKTIHDFGGYIAQEEQNQLDDRLQTSMSIKVPVAQFDVLMNQLSSGDVKVVQKKISSEDVTGETVDTKSRLEAKKQMRLKYFDFLKQAKNMDEALQVQKEINDIQEAIESADGRVGFLSHEAAFSTINLTFFQPLKVAKSTTEPATFSSRTGSAFHSGARWMADIFVGMMSVWPLILLAIAIIIYWKKMYSNKPGSQQKKL